MSKIINKKILWEGRFLTGVLFEYKNSKSGNLTWEACQRINCSGIVAIVPFTQEKEVIVIKQYRPPVEKYVIEFPAGLNDKNESLQEVAKRELLEETGYFVDKLEQIAVGPLSAGASTEVLTVFLAKNVYPAADQNLELEEEIEIIRLPMEHFYERLYSLENHNTYI
ncbi:NUDIX hydrolase, partial [Candidatus Magnetoovum chiemensis]